MYAMKFDHLFSLSVDRTNFEASTFLKWVWSIVKMRVNINSHIRHTIDVFGCPPHQFLCIQNNLCHENNMCFFGFCDNVIGEE